MLRRANWRADAREPSAGAPARLPGRRGGAGQACAGRIGCHRRPRPRTLALTGVEALTPSERRVARMAARGVANKEIAEALFVTVKAVEAHLSSVYRKLQIKSRTQLADVISGLR